jgi:hypothetical protein
MISLDATKIAGAPLLRFTQGRDAACSAGFDFDNRRLDSDPCSLLFEDERRWGERSRVPLDKNEGGLKDKLVLSVSLAGWPGLLQEPF